LKESQSEQKNIFSRPFSTPQHIGILMLWKKPVFFNYTSNSERK